MELQLGFSLSNHNFSDGFQSKEMMGWRNYQRLSDKKKRSFEETTSAPLLSWSGQPNDKDDDEQRDKKRPSCPLINKNGVVAAEEEALVVGWPPIKSWRKKLLHHHQQGGRVVMKNRVAAPATIPTKDLVAAFRVEMVYSCLVLFWIRSGRQTTGSCNSVSFNSKES